MIIQSRLAVSKTTHRASPAKITAGDGSHPPLTKPAVEPGVVNVYSLSPPARHVVPTKARRLACVTRDLRMRGYLHVGTWVLIGTHTFMSRSLLAGHRSRTRW